MRQLLILGAACCFIIAIPLFSIAQGKTDTYKKVADDMIASYNKKEFDQIRNHFSGPVKLILTQNKVNTLFDGLYKQGGRIISYQDPQSEEPAVIAVPLLFEKDSLRLDMVLFFNEKNKLTGLSLLSPNRVKYPKITDTTTIDDIAQPYISKPENAGLSVGIYVNGKEQFFNYGVMEKGETIQPDSGTLYEICSITKVFTSILLADLVKKGIVNYKDPLSKFLPDSIPPITYKNREITLLDLATHRSGLPAIPDNLEATMKDSLNPYANYSVQDLYSYLQHVKLERAPGAVYEYSNLGMGLLGEILSQRIKLTYEEAIKKEVLSGTGMTNTTVSLSEEQRNHFAKGYNEKGSLTPYWDFLTLQGAGAIRSNTKDMIQFIQLNVARGEKKPLDAIHEAQIKRTDETALGWHFMTLNKETIYWHNGGTYGFTSFIGFDKEKNIGVVVLSNSGNDVDKIGELILELLLRENHP